MNALAGQRRGTKKKRVAIYVRQSVDRSTDSNFGSLEAQQESIEAYIKSRAFDGWEAIPGVYSDGGFSGKDIDRPGFQRLLQDIELGLIDCVVVYKVDRLSRSIRDFAKVMDIFDQHGVEFASVTQQFSTANSMGKLTLNILMSFAEFERDVISERTRDKIHASRKRGIWPGGHAPLGYVGKDGKLEIVKDEAKRVREIFELYLQHGSLAKTVAELDRRGWRTKRGGKWKTSSLSVHLKQVIYIGKVRHHEEVFNGLHKAIVSQELFDDVQELLRGNGHAGGSRAKNKWNLLLRGLLVCGGCGLPMGHTYTRKKDALYHYYVCRASKLPTDFQCPGARLNAHEVETFVIDKIRAIGKDENVVAATVKAALAEARKKKPTLLAEKRTVASQLKKLQKERKGLFVALAKDRRATGAITDRLLEIDQEIFGVETRVEEIDGELEALKNGTVSEDEVAKALGEFDEIWHELLPKEKQRILSLLVEEIRFEPETGDIAISYHPAGLSALTKRRMA